ncbi:hypothetical protein ABHI18_007665 [Aspergillus niger]
MSLRGLKFFLIHVGSVRPRPPMSYHVTPLQRSRNIFYSED